MFSPQIGSENPGIDMNEFLEYLASYFLAGPPASDIPGLRGHLREVGPLREACQARHLRILGVQSRLEPLHPPRAPRAHRPPHWPRQLRLHRVPRHVPAGLPQRHACRRAPVRRSLTHLGQHCLPSHYSRGAGAGVGSLPMSATVPALPQNSKVGIRVGSGWGERLLACHCVLWFTLFHCLWRF